MQTKTTMYKEIFDSKMSANTCSSFETIFSITNTSKTQYWRWFSFSRPSTRQTRWCYVRKLRR